jgi:prophage regulatory protein
MSNTDVPNHDTPTCGQKILRLADVMKLTAISRSQIYNLMTNGQFPTSIPLVPGGTSVGWVHSEIENWIQSRIDARNERAQA